MKGILDVRLALYIRYLRFCYSRYEFNWNTIHLTLIINQ